MNKYAFLEQWERWYPQSVPVGHLLRESHPNRWLRIYSLPGGQRYPEGDQDWRELLDRQSAAADVVLGAQQECLFVAAYFDAGADTQALTAQFRFEELALVRDDFPEDGSAPDDHSVDLWCAPVVWQRPTLEPALRLRANDRGPTFLLVALATGHVFAPYDGGVDLFAPTPNALAQFRAQLRPWVSPRSDGL